MNDDSLRVGWFLRTDFVIIKKTARMIARESRRFGYSTGLNDTFGVDNDVTQSKLNIWCKHGHSRRGLEEWSNKANHGGRRKEAKKEALRGILEAQTELRSSDIPEDDQIEVLGRFAASLTESARIFARMMGIADAFAVTSDDQNFRIGIAQAGERTRNNLVSASSLPQPYHRQAIGDTFRARGEALDPVIEEGVESSTVPELVPDSPMPISQPGGEKQ
eukprot:CAMPEP_0119004442 /NCGR_PEP_ID=MMETSP1176-20130426/1143_1 /TAXON_ID=265551 /ORGANISM="Synedropsis recta cf, Strain CCMP1620" /LENGTH=218 /DNA_ID=CAMNT_0006956143 /DNA_START=617 /DNA_END=1273 /DNA_ORIENTATION=-